MCAIDTVEIPGPFTPRRTFDVPPISVRIPLVAHTRPVSWLIFAAAHVFFGILLLLTASLFLSAVFYIGYDQISLTETTITLVSGLLIFGLGAYSLAVAVTCIFDGLESAPVREISGRGLRDIRLALDVSRDAVERMKFVSDRRGLTGLRLTMREAIDVRRDRFRLGSGSLRQRPKTEIMISLAMLDVKPYVLAHTAAVFIQQHGGIADLSRWP